MKKLLLTLFVVAGTFTAAVAQDYKKVFFKDLTIENNHVKVTVEDAVATATGIKFRLKIFNKTNDICCLQTGRKFFQDWRKRLQAGRKMVDHPTE